MVERVLNLGFQQEFKSQLLTACFIYLTFIGRTVGMKPPQLCLHRYIIHELSASDTSTKCTEYHGCQR